MTTLSWARGRATVIRTTVVRPTSNWGQATILMQESVVEPSNAFVDLDCRGVDADNPNVHIVYRGKTKHISEQERKQLRWRQAIEPIIGHLKADHRMDRCHL